MAELAKFDGFTLRAIEDKDLAQLREWIAADAAHVGVLTPEFFMGEDPRSNAFVIEGGDGELMYVRLARASRVHIQFRPQPRGASSIREHRRQMRMALLKGMAFLEVGLKHAGCTEWIFDSESSDLRALARVFMGFQASPNELVRFIPPQEVA
jgi:hypothetical protein